MKRVEHSGALTASTKSEAHVERLSFLCGVSGVSAHAAFSSLGSWSCIFQTRFDCQDQQVQ